MHSGTPTCKFRNGGGEGRYPGVHGKANDLFVFSLRDLEVDESDVLLPQLVVEGFGEGFVLGEDLSLQSGDLLYDRIRVFAGI